MKFPTEEEVEVVISDITSHMGKEENQSSEDHLENCTFCSTMKELDNRSNFGKEQPEPCAIDNFIMHLCQNDPGLMLALNVFGPVAGRGVIELGRICFVLGLKLSDSKHAAEELKKMFGEI